MKVVEIIREHILLISLIILPFYCFISRKLYKPLFSYPFIEINDNSFFGVSGLRLRKNESKEKIFNIKDYNNTRLFVESHYNKIILYFTLSKHIYYDDYNSSFYISLNINDSLLINNQYSIYYSDSFENNSNIIKIKKNKNLITELFSMKKNISLNSISVNFTKNDTNLKCELSFEDFDIIMNLKREKLTYRFFYLFECLLTVLIQRFFLAANFWEKNFQNINHLFFIMIWTKLNFFSVLHLFDLFKVRLPILKLMFFYPHLLIHGEFLLSISDIISIFLAVWIILLDITFIYLFFEVEKNYIYCFSNKIENNEIVIKNPKVKANKLFSYINMFLFIDIFLSHSVFIQSIPLIIVIVLTIIKHLNQRDVMYKKDRDLCIYFYSVGVVIYSYFLILYNLGEFYRSKPIYTLFPFILIFVLYFILLSVLINEYKFKYVMIKDFERIKKLDKECCPICLKDYIYDKKKIGMLFCKASQNENIHETKCNHYFHEKCLFVWRKYRNICPVCKARLYVPDYYFFYDETPCIYKAYWI